MTVALRNPLLLELDDERRCVLSAGHIRLAAGELSGTVYVRIGGRAQARSVRLPLTEIDDAIPFTGTGEDALTVNDGWMPASAPVALPQAGGVYRAYAANTTYTGTVAQIVERGGWTLVMLAIERGAQLALDAATVRFEEIR
jgi:hypothetical protein